MKFETKFSAKVDGIKEAMSRDAFLNETKNESPHVSVQDVSDCPDIQIKFREYSHESEEIFRAA